MNYNLQLEKLEQETVKWCREILRNSPTAIRVLKSALNAVDDGHAGLQVSSNSSYLHLTSFAFFFTPFSVVHEVLSAYDQQLIFLSGAWRKCHPHILWNRGRQRGEACILATQTTKFLEISTPTLKLNLLYSFVVHSEFSSTPLKRYGQVHQLDVSTIV